MKTLSVTYASSPSADLLIATLEFQNEEAGAIRLAQSFNDLTATTELAETVTFIESEWSFNWASSCEINKLHGGTPAECYAYASAERLCMCEVFLLH